MSPPKHPCWFDSSESFLEDEWKFAVALGRGVGLTSPDDWTHVEAGLRELWEDLSQDQSWTQVRSAIYWGWWAVRRTSDDPGPDAPARH